MQPPSPPPLPVVVLDDDSSLKCREHVKNYIDDSWACLPLYSFDYRRMIPSRISRDFVDSFKNERGSLNYVSSASSRQTNLRN